MSFRVWGYSTHGPGVAHPGADAGWGRAPLITSWRRLGGQNTDSRIRVRIYGIRVRTLRDSRIRVRIYGIRVSNLRTAE